MKVKRLVSVLLAALLLVGMIPMNAMAALESTSPKLEIKLMISKTAPTETVAEVEGLDKTSSESDIDAAIEAANKAWTWDKSGNVELNPGEPVYIGVKIIPKDGEYNAVQLARVLFVYDSNVLEPSTGELSSGKAFTDTLLYNQANLEVFEQTFFAKKSNHYSESAAAGGTLERKYFPSEMAFDNTGSSQEAAGEGYTNKNLIAVKVKGDSENLHYATSKLSTWDYVIPLKVKANAKGTATFEVIESYGIATVTSVDLTKDVSDNATTINNNLQTLNKNTVAWGTGLQTVSNDVTVTVASNDPDLTVTDANKTVAVANNEAKLVVSNNGKNSTEFTTDAATKTNWTVTQDGKTPSVTAAEVSSDKSTVTLTVSGVGAGTIKVEAKTAAGAAVPGVLKNGTGTLSTVKYTAVAAPSAPAITASDTGTDTAVTVPAGTYYKLGSGNWTEAPAGGAKLTVAQLTGAMNGTPTSAGGVDTYTGVFAVAADAAGKISTDVPLKKFSAPANVKAGTEIGTNDVVVDFTTEKLYLKSGLTATFSGTAVTSGGSLTAGLTSGKNRKLVVSKAASGDTFGMSAEYTLPARPTHAALTVTTEDSVAQTGKTTVSIAKDDKYLVQATSATEPTTIDALTSTATTAVTSLNATIDDTIYVATPGQNNTTTFASSKWASTIASAVGKGWNYSKVDVANKVLDADQTTITLTKTGPIDWATFSAANFELKEADSTTTIAATALDTTTGVLTIATAPVKGKNYVLTVKKEAIAGGALNSKTGSNQTINLTGPTDDAVSVSLGDGYEPAATVVSKGAEVTITVTKGLEGKTMTRVTSSDTDKLTVVEFSGKTIKVKATDTVSGTAATNPVTLTIEAEPTALEYAETTSVELADTTEKTIAPTNAAALTGVTVTVAPVGDAPAAGVVVDADNLTLKTAGDKFTAKGDYQYKVTGSNGATAMITITVTGIQATPDFSGLTKKWDDTDSLTTNVTGTVVWKDKNGATLTATSNTATYKLSNKAVGTTGNVAVTAGTLTTASATYDVAAGTYDVTVQKADTASVEVGAPTAKAGKISAVAEALAKTPVTVTTDTGVKVEKTLGDLVSKDDIQAEIIDQIGDAAKTAAEKAKAQEAAKAFAADPANDGKDAFDADGNPTSDFTTWAGTATTEEGGATTWSDAITAAGTDAKAAVTAETSLKKGDKLDLTQLTLGTTINDANINDPANTDNYDTSKLTDAFAITGGSTGGGGGSYVPSVELVTGGFGTADGPVELDENNKITKLPGVTGQKLGSVFKGWATQEGNPNTIVKEGREITTDTTLYGIFEGYMNGDKPVNGKRTARPNDNVTRGELVTMLVRAAGIYDDSIDYTTTFADAKDGWYSAYVGCAETAGILTGDAEGTARPKDNITREEAAILIAKTFKVDVAIGGTTEHVVDFNKTASWAKDFVAAIVNNGTSVGNENKEYEPKKPITRAEVAAMINKYLGLTASQKANLSADTTVTSPFVDVTNKNGWYYAEMIFASLNAPDTYYGTEIVYPTR